MDFYGWNIRSRRDEIIRQGTGQQLTAFVVYDFLQQRPAKSLRNRAKDLSLGNHRIDDDPAVVSDDIFKDPWSETSAVDFDQRGMSGVGPGHRRWLKILRNLKPAGKAWGPHVGGSGHGCRSDLPQAQRHI